MQRERKYSLNIWGCCHDRQHTYPFLHWTFDKALPLPNARHERTRNVRYCNYCSSALCYRTACVHDASRGNLDGWWDSFTWLDKLLNDEVRQGLPDEVQCHNHGTAKVCSQLRTELYLSNVDLRLPSASPLAFVP